MEPNPRPAIRIFNKIVETIAYKIIPASRQMVLADLEQVQPPWYAWQVFNCTAQAILEETALVLCPAANIDRGSPSKVEKRKRFRTAPRELSRPVLMWVIACLVLMELNSYMLPDVGVLRDLAVLIPGVLLIIAVVLTKDGLATMRASGDVVEQDSVTDEGFLRVLIEDKGRLCLGGFSPSELPVRAGMAATAVMMMFFPLLYVVLRRTAGDPLPEGFTWAIIGWSLFPALFLLVLFIFIRTCHQFAADAFQKEIDALKSAQKKPQSMSA